jgi:hypothetical protein
MSGKVLTSQPLLFVIALMIKINILYSILAYIVIFVNLYNSDCSFPQFFVCLQNKAITCVFTLHFFQKPPG